MALLLCGNLLGVGVVLHLRDPWEKGNTFFIIFIIYSFLFNQLKNAVGTYFSLRGAEGHD